MNQKQRKEQEAAKRKKRAEAARKDRAAKKALRIPPMTREEREMLIPHDRTIYTLSQTPAEYRSKHTLGEAALEPAAPRPIQPEVANPQTWEGPTLEITRPFGVVLRARVQREGYIRFAINAGQDEISTSPEAFSTTAIEHGISLAISIAEEVSRERARKLLDAQGFTIETEASVCANSPKKA